MRKILIVATAAVMIALAAQAAKTAKAVFEDDRATLRFVYDEYNTTFPTCETIRLTA